MADIIRIPPLHYIHILDTNSNVTRLCTGPSIIMKQDHQKLISGKDPKPMISIPPRCYVVIANPAIINDGSVSEDKHGQVNVRHGDLEIRLHDSYPDPFPLYPREELRNDVEKLKIIPADSALLIQAEREHEDSKGLKRLPGDLWYFSGPGTYIPRIEQNIAKLVPYKNIIINQALTLRAQRELVDSSGCSRKAGEEWLIREQGAYLPGVYETVVEIVSAKVLTDYQAIHLRAARAFKDVYGKERKAGEEWLVTSETSSMHIQDVYEEFVKDVKITVLAKNQYCVVLDPMDSKTANNRYGYKELRRGEDRFFLQPGESLEGGIRDTYVLSEDEALLLKAKEAFDDEEAKEARSPGDRWMIGGPCSYIPPVQVEVLAVRKAIPLHINEGIYVRDIKSGTVRSEIGKSYMLKAHEELWEMPLSDVVEKLLEDAGQKRVDKTRVVSYKCPANCVVQIYDYSKKQSRCICGPDLLMLKPDEQFTVNVLSGGKPKKVGVVKTLHLQLGPDFSTDVIEVDTSDHARLRLQLSYNWKFIVDKSDENSYKKAFQVRDFIGNICNYMASRVRGVVASCSFDHFHRESAKIIRKSIFGQDESGKIQNEFHFPENSISITNVDIQSIEPVERQTKERLQESVTLAIEITTQNEEAKARHASERQAQEALGQLEKLRIENQAKVEEENNKLYQLRSDTEIVQIEGEALAKAKAEAGKNRIKAQSVVDAADLRSKAERLSKENEIRAVKNKQQVEVEFQRIRDEMEISRVKQLAEIESSKFRETIGSIGPETLVALSEAGPKLQAELLQGLGLTGYLMMDSDNPVNLFNTAQGLLGFGGS